VTPLISRILFGLVFSGLIGALAYWRGSLMVSGIFGAVIVGTAIFGFGGAAWGLVLITFFVLSSGLSRFKQAQKERIAGEKFDKGSQRDIWQVFANGGVGSIIAAIYYFDPNPLWLAAFVGAMATVNADTWATELGTLAEKPPRLITTFNSVVPGTSGGVSVPGALATLAGAAVIGAAAWGLIALDRGASNMFGGWLVLIGAAGGLAGSLFDSLLGATIQAMYYSPCRDKETEKRIDPNGQPNEHIRGWVWLNNDMVNFVSSVVGAGVGVLVSLAVRTLV